MLLKTEPYAAELFALLLINNRGNDENREEQDVQKYLSPHDGLFSRMGYTSGPDLLYFQDTGTVSFEH